MNPRSFARLRAMLILSLGITLMLGSLPSTNAVAIPSLQVHESRSYAPNGWKRGSRLNKKSTLPIRIALVQSNLDQLHDHLMSVSEPSSNQYGQHWSVEKVKKEFAPSEKTRTAVTEWLVEAGIASHRLSHNDGSGGWIAFEATTEEAENLFQTKYFHWTHPNAGNEGDSFPAVEESYSLPAHIRPHIDFVTPTLHFDMKLNYNKGKEQLEKRRLVDEKIMEKRQLGSKKINLGSPDSPALPKVVSVQNPQEIFLELNQCDQFITPVCLRALYNIPTLPSILPTNSKNSFAIVEYTPQQYNASDLALFFSNYSTNQKHLTPNLVSIDGGSIDTPGASGFGFEGESNLDLEYSMTLVNPIPVTLYEIGDIILGASFNNFLDAFDASFCAGDDPIQDSHYPDPYGGYTGPEACGTVAPAKVISTSYSYNEHDLSPAYEIRQCNEYAKLGLLGTTFAFSSGDYGVASNVNQCIDPVTGAYNDGKSGRFAPTFPGTCPYILSIGATQINPNASVYAPESACQTVATSSGGFSDVFPLPSYQKSAVGNYFAKHKPSYTSTQYNNSMMTRGFPDVSANGANYLVTVDGQYNQVFGTSASSPVFASVLTLINENRLNIGKSSLGFVNPALYANPSMFNDITSGNNPGCGTNGFSAVTGWDPVTGLGTPNYVKMLAYFLLV